MAAAMVFLFAHSFKSEIVRPKVHNIEIQDTDFLTYRRPGMAWYTFQFVLAITPPILIFSVRHHYSHLVDQSLEKSYLPIMYALWGKNVLSFLFNADIYEWKQKATIHEIKSSYKPPTINEDTNEV